MPDRVWHSEEEGYLKQLHDLALRFSRRYMAMYKTNHSFQTKLRLPSIVMSSFSGVASFGSSNFPRETVKYVSIVIGIINVSIAIVQTYESYLKLGDIVTKSLSVATGLKKLADDIFCELYIPVVDRDDDGIIFLRDCFNRYHVIMDGAPPFPPGNEDDDDTQTLKKMIADIIRQRGSQVQQERVEIGKSFRPSYPEARLLPPNHVFNGQATTGEERIVIGSGRTIPSPP